MRAPEWTALHRAQRGELGMLRGANSRPRSGRFFWPDGGAQRPANQGVDATLGLVLQAKAAGIDRCRTCIYSNIVDCWAESPGHQKKQRAGNRDPPAVFTLSLSQGRQYSSSSFSPSDEFTTRWNAGVNASSSPGSVSSSDQSLSIVKAWSSGASSSEPSYPMTAPGR